MLGRAPPSPEPRLTPEPNDVAKMPFEAALAELEAIVDRLEKGNVSLEDSITLYERGEALKARCEELLKNAEMRIEKIALGQRRQAEGARAAGPEVAPLSGAFGAAASWPPRRRRSEGLAVSALRIDGRPVPWLSGGHAGHRFPRGSRRRGARRARRGGETRRRDGARRFPR